MCLLIVLTSSHDSVVVASSHDNVVASSHDSVAHVVPFIDLTDRKVEIEKKKQQKSTFMYVVDIEKMLRYG